MKYGAIVALVEPSVKLLKLCPPSHPLVDLTLTFSQPCHGSSPLGTPAFGISRCTGFDGGCGPWFPHHGAAHLRSMAAPLETVNKIAAGHGLSSGAARGALTAT